MPNKVSLGGVVSTIVTKRLRFATLPARSASVYRTKNFEFAAAIIFIGLTVTILLEIFPSKMSTPVAPSSIYAMAPSINKFEFPFKYKTGGSVSIMTMVRMTCIALLPALSRTLYAKTNLVPAIALDLIMLLPTTVMKELTSP